MGCEGVLTQTQDYNGVPAVLREWGKEDNSIVDHAILSLFNNKVISKRFIFKDAKSTCMPSLDKWQALQFDITYDQAQSATQCGGVLQMLFNQSKEEDKLQSLYGWQNFLSKDAKEGEELPLGGIAHQLFFVGGKLKTKSYTNNTQPFSSCVPTKLGFEKITLREDWNIDKNQNAMGCPALLTSSSESSSDSQKQYSWGETAAQYAYVTLDTTGKIIEKYISFTPAK
jgi:hypothetical protein